jgi:lysophospholipase L1-like esterase
MPYLLSLFPLPARAQAEVQGQFDRPTRYMALGDSLAAGYGAVPVTLGYAYLLYQSTVFDAIHRTHFCNAAVPGAASLDVLKYQVPQAVDKFHPTVITLSVGGNDLLPLLDGSEPGQVLDTFRTNLVAILQRLRIGLPEAKIYISNLYSIPKIPETEAVVPVFNRLILHTARAFDVPVADVYSAFRGREGLLQIERDGAPRDEVHPTNAGYRVMAQAFEEAVKGRKKTAADSHLLFRGRL